MAFFKTMWSIIQRYIMYATLFARYGELFSHLCDIKLKFSIIMFPTVSERWEIVSK